MAQNAKQKTSLEINANPGSNSLDKQRSENAALPQSNVGDTNVGGEHSDKLAAKIPEETNSENNLATQMPSVSDDKNTNKGSVPDNGKSDAAEENDEETLIKVDDTRIERLHGEAKQLEFLLKKIVRLAKEKHVYEVGEKRQQKNLDFANELIRAGQDIIEAGQILIEKGGVLKDWAIKAISEEKAREIEEEQAMMGNTSSQSDTEEGRAAQEAEREKVRKEKRAARRQREKSDAAVSGCVKVVTQNGKKKRVYVCNVCQATLGTKRMLEDHLSRHTGKKYSCDKCPKMFTLRLRLKQHEDFHKNGPWKCSFCGKEFDIKTSWLNHEAAHRNKGKWKCSVCGKTFDQKYHFKDHTATKHKKEKTITCNLCGEKVQSLTALGVHKSRKHRERDLAGVRLP